MAGLMENVAQKGVEKKQILHNSTAEVRAQLNFSSRIRELDGYRGFAWAVCLSFPYVWVATLGPSPDHLNFLHKAPSLLWSGMEMFFVLSGFLIGGILLD